MAHST